MITTPSESCDSTISFWGTPETLNAKSWFIGKDPDAGKDWGQEEKGTTEDEIVGWHHRLNGHGSGWTPGVGDGQGGLMCCSSWGCKESDTTERLNWIETFNNIIIRYNKRYPVLNCFWKVKSVVTQLCPTLCNPMDCSPPGSSVHDIL